jgi:hypothetical protein
VRPIKVDVHNHENVRQIVFALSGLVITMLAIGPSVRRLKPGRGWWILRVIMIRTQDRENAIDKAWL